MHRLIKEKPQRDRNTFAVQRQYNTNMPFNPIITIHSNNLLSTSLSSFFLLFLLKCSFFLLFLSFCLTLKKSTGCIERSVGHSSPNSNLVQTCYKEGKLWIWMKILWMQKTTILIQSGKYYFLLNPACASFYEVMWYSRTMVLRFQFQLSE